MDASMFCTRNTVYKLREHSNHTATGGICCETVTNALVNMVNDAVMLEDAWTDWHAIYGRVRMIYNLHFDDFLDL